MALLMLSQGCSQKAPPAGVNGGGAGAAQPDKELGNFEPVPGRPFLVAPIVDRPDGYAGRGSGSFSSSNYSQLPRNYVFLDTAHETFQRLLPSNGWRVLAKNGFPGKNGPETAPEPTEWFVYDIVKADTNKDGQLSYGDALTIAVSDAAGRDYTELLSDVEQVHSTSLREPSTLLVVYRSQARSWIARVDLKTRQVESTTELPSFGPEVR